MEQKPKRPKERALIGELIDYGPAPYLYKPDNSPSFYVKLKTQDGQEVTHWGVDLERAREASRAHHGDWVELARQKPENSSHYTWSVHVLREKALEGQGGKTDEPRKQRAEKKPQHSGANLQSQPQPPQIDAPSKITGDFAEKRLSHWSPEERASFKEKTNELRSAIGKATPYRSR